MKQLFITRHAQAMPSDGMGDIKRKLTPVGTNDAQALGQVMKAKNYSPDFVLCSPAIRTRETLSGILQSFEKTPVQYENIIYEGSHDELLTLIQSAGDKFGSLLIIGHNPSIHALAATLAQEDSPSMMNRLSSGYSPGMTSVLEVPCDNWRDIKPGENRLADILESIDYNAPSTPARWI